MRLVVLGIIVVALDVRPTGSIDLLPDPIGYWVVTRGLLSIEHRHRWLHLARQLATVLILLSVPALFIPFNEVAGPLLVWSMAVMALDVALIWFSCGAIAELLWRENGAVADLAIRRRGYYMMAALLGAAGILIPAPPVIVMIVATQLLTLGLVLLLFYHVGQFPGWD